ncbi:MAG TPA: hypothetical protein VFJ98_02490 [Mycobacteriales bacterium]|nr:hypothetical protein [Mycobacteriales bacterium]
MIPRRRQQRRPALARAGGLLVALLSAATAVLVGPPATGAQAQSTICVALVVDSSALGGDVDNGCTRVPSGATGYDVLRAGGHSWQVCDNGIIGEIDGRPANGCQVKDNNHFWGYWHRKPGSRTWTFSSYGAGYYHPGEGSTDGWVWEDGTTSPPADVAYPAGCHSPPSSPTPTPAPSTSSAGPAPHAGGGTAPAATHAPAAASPPAGSTTGARSTRSDARHRRGSRTARSSARPTATDPTAAAPTSPPAAPTVEAVHRTRSADGSGSPAPALAAVAGAALLGAGAWWRSRRRAGTP